jgi:ribosome modulation factor
VRDDTRVYISPPLSEQAERVEAAMAQGHKDGLEGEHSRESDYRDFDERQCYAQGYSMGRRGGQ